MEISREELEREYSPSSCVENYLELIDSYRTRSQRSEAECDFVKDLQYGDNADELLDLCLPTQKNAPLVVFIHGGYWQELSKNESTFAGAELVRRGIAFAAVDYTIAPSGTIEKMVEQCVSSLVWLHANAAKFGYCPDAIYVAGSSAGAHLATMALLGLKHMNGSASAVPIRGVILLSGLFDLRPIVDLNVNEPLGLNEARASSLSPMLADLSDLPHALICWGENETAEFKRQSREFAQLYRSSGNTADDFEVAARNHFDVVYILELLIAESDQLRIAAGGIYYGF